MRTFLGLLAALLVAGAGTVPAAAPALATTAASRAPAASAGVAGLPADPAATGAIGLCNERNQNVTGGSIDATPFVWKAVTTTRPPAAYQGRAQNTVLNIYQPRPDAEPSDYSGGSLNSATFYDRQDLPTAQSTYSDQSLRQFIGQYPPKADGLYQLRMYYGRQGYGIYTSRYPVTTIQVVGSRWHVVRGVAVDCAGGTGVSNEQATGVVTRAQVTAHRPAAGQRTTAAPPGTVLTGGTGTSGGGHAALAWSLAAGVALLLVLAVSLLLHRRHRRAPRAVLPARPERVATSSGKGARP